MGSLYRDKINGSQIDLSMAHSWEWEVRPSKNFRSNDELVKHLRASNLLQSHDVEQALRAVDRADYVDQSPYSNVVSSSPAVALQAVNPVYLNAVFLSLLRRQLRPGQRVLHVASCGCGHLPACIAYLLAPTGLV